MSRPCPRRTTGGRGGAIVATSIALLAGSAGALPGTATASPATLAAAPLAAGSPFSGDQDDGADQRTEADAETGTRTGAAAPTPAGVREDRLDRIARELRRTPFVVDPELDWMVDARTSRSIVRLLRGARIPIFVAVLPAVDEDESGGDLERVVQRLQREVGRDGLYVAVDQDSRMDLASVGVPLDLGISFSVLTPPRDERPYEEQERDPAPPPAASIPGRLQEIVDTVAQAGPGTPNGVIDDVRELSSLPGEARAAREQEDAQAGVILGVLLGLTLAGTVLGVARVRRSVRDGGGPTPGGTAGGRPPGTGGQRRGSSAARRRRGRGRRA